MTIPVGVCDPDDKDYYDEIKFRGSGCGCCSRDIRDIEEMEEAVEQLEELLDKCRQKFEKKKQKQEMIQ